MSNLSLDNFILFWWMPLMFIILMAIIIDDILSKQLWVVHYMDSGFVNSNLSNTSEYMKFNEARAHLKSFSDATHIEKVQGHFNVGRTFTL